MKKERPRLNGVINRIASVGVELEGGWTKDPGQPIQRDPSVKFVPPKGVEDPATGRIVYPPGTVVPRWTGEIPTPNGGLPVTTVEAWMLQYYPQLVNETCGMHVHTSFKRKMHYQQLMTPEFTKRMVTSLQEWAEAEGFPATHHIWARLKKPDHPHCAHTYCGDEQVKMKKKDFNSRGTPWSRYTAINYCAAQHNTIECRLLPMMETAEQGVRAVMRVLDTTNRFLSQIRQKETKHFISIPHRGEVLQDYTAYVR